MSDIRQTHYIDTAEAAWLLDVSPRTVNRWVAKGRLPIAYRVLDGSAVTAHRYERDRVGRLAQSLGREPKCLACGIRKSTHPHEDCRGFINGWTPR